MLSAPNHEAHTVALEQKLRSAAALTPDLMSDVIAQACPRLSALSLPAKARVSRLIASGAWSDAALTLLELELPQWKVRRLVSEDGEWLCSLSKQPWIPFGLDELAEASHQSMPLAILLALIEAQCASPAAKAVAVPSVRPVPGHAMCCDNFA
jgi:hypothetical protein